MISFQWGFEIYSDIAHYTHPSVSNPQWLAYKVDKSDQTTVGDFEDANVTVPTNSNINAKALDPQQSATGQGYGAVSCYMVGSAAGNRVYFGPTRHIRKQSDAGGAIQLGYSNRGALFRFAWKSANVTTDRKGLVTIFGDAIGSTNYGTREVLLHIETNTSGQLIATSGNGVVAITSTEALSTNAWHNIGIFVQGASTSSATDGWVDVYLDGARVLTTGAGANVYWSNDTATSYSGEIGWIAFQNEGTSGVTMDHLVFWDGQNVVHSSDLVNDIEHMVSNKWFIQGFYPTSNNSLGNFARAGATTSPASGAYLDVSGVDPSGLPPMSPAAVSFDDSEYIESAMSPGSSGTTDTALFNLVDHDEIHADFSPGALGAISVINAVDTTYTTPVTTPVLKSGSSTSAPLTWPISGPASEFNVATWPRNPDGSAVWDRATLNAAICGVKVTL